MTRARDVANVLSTATSLATDTETASAISSHNTAGNGHVSRGNTASRPASPTVGDFYSNTQTGVLEIYESTGWTSVVPPSAPSSVVATNQGSGRAYNNGQSSVAFSAGTFAGTTYTITSSPGSYTASGSTSPITITGLQSSTQYTYTAVASSKYGTSSASSASTGVTATTVPQAPTIDSVTAGDAQASVAFTAGATGGSAITGYTVTSSPGSITASGASSPLVVTGLTNGTSYTFTAVATNANGTSSASSASNSITPTQLTSYESIASVTVGSGGSSTVTFNSIPDTYSHLQIRVFARGGRSDAEQYAGGIYFQFNSNFLTSQHQLRGVGATLAAQGWSGGLSNGFIMLWVPASNAQANTFGVGIIDILDYANTNKNKVARILSGNELNTNGGAVAMTTASWDSTSAITSITFGPTDGTGTIPQYSEFALYGIKGS